MTMRGLRRLSEKMTRPRLRRFLQTHATRERVLDLGCGPAPYRDLFPRRVGVDLRPGPGVHVVADARALPFRDGQFRVAVATEFLEHVPEPDRVLAELERVLVAGGKLVLTTRFVYPLHDLPGDFYRYTPEGLRFLLRNWDIAEIVEEADTCTTLGILVQRLAYQAEFVGGRMTRMFLYLVARLLPRMRRMVRRQYGDIARTRQVANMMVSGYYLVAFRRHPEEHESAPTHVNRTEQHPP